uniref:hypothetical protein n=1 Tax=Sphingomonas sp. CFBP 13706 TaxID=2775314 RepID=UPI001FD015AC|nr:hypothetical protein [Sphingomonas sp. CFBP 13706]
MAFIVSNSSIVPDARGFLEAVAIMARYLAVVAELVYVRFVDVQHSAAILFLGLRIGFPRGIETIDSLGARALWFRVLFAPATINALFVNACSVRDDKAFASVRAIGIRTPPV